MGQQALHLHPIESGLRRAIRAIMRDARRVVTRIANDGKHEREFISAQYRHRREIALEPPILRGCYHDAADTLHVPNFAAMLVTEPGCVNRLPRADIGVSAPATSGAAHEELSAYMCREP